jgi:hypothetical protein
MPTYRYHVIWFDAEKGWVEAVATGNREEAGAWATLLDSVSGRHDVRIQRELIRWQIAQRPSASNAVATSYSG